MISPSMIGHTKPKEDAAAPEPPNEVLEVLGRIIDSQSFRGSPRQGRFLRFVVEQALMGKGGSLKEYSIGVEVFNKDPSFDPRLNTIVRTEARRLRARLARFYESEAKPDDIRISLPKGSYIASFEASRPVNVVSAPPGVPRGPEQAVNTSAPPESPRRSLRFLFTGLVGVSILFGLAAVPIARSLRGARNESKISSLVVLPFTNLSGPGNEFFSDGMTDELIDSLSQQRGLRVVGRASAFQFKGKSADLVQIGRRLKVSSVVSGSVQESNGKLRISVWLEDTVRGDRLWSQTFDREKRDAFLVQSDISRAVTEAIGAKLDVTSTENPAKRVSADAYEAYLRGLYFWNRSTARDIQMAIRYFNQAIAKDPDYADPYVGIAACYIAMPTVSTAVLLDYMPQIRTAATKALSLNRRVGDAHFELAVALESERKWPEAETEFKRGFETNPGSSMGHRWYASYLMRIGRADEALVEKKAAVNLDPVSLIAAQRLGEGFYELHRYDEAIRQYKATLELENNFGLAHLGLGMAELQAGQQQAAISELRRANDLMGADLRTMAQLGYAYALSGNHNSAQRMLDDLLRRSNRERIPALPISLLYLGLGEYKSALTWLEKACDEGEPLLLKTSPLYDPLRSEPRFKALVARMKV